MSKAKYKKLSIVENLTVNESDLFNTSILSGFSNSTISANYINGNNLESRDQLVDYFYIELLKYVVEEHSVINQDKTEDSDEEPTYDIESVSETEEAENINTHEGKSVIYSDSHSKLRSHILASQSYAKHKSQIMNYQLQNKPESSFVYNQRPRSTKIRYQISNVNNVPIEKKPFSFTKEQQQTQGDRNSEFMSAISTGASGELRDASLMGEHTENQNNSLIVLSQDWFENDSGQKQRMTIKFITGALYTGEIVSYKFNGKGIYTWPEGVKYEGEFKNGQITGFGKLIYRDMSYYQGTLTNCVLNGTGTFCPSDTNIAYSGNWFNGVPHGKGQLRYHETDWYEGQWQEGLRHGQGTRLYANKAVYVGCWDSGNPSGKGSMLYSNRDFYHGDWSHGLPNGYGQYIWKATLTDGIRYSMVNSYTGHFVNGARDGYGVQTFGMEGSKLASLFDDNMKSGPGILICGNGVTIEKKTLFVLDNPSASKSSSQVIDSISLSQINQNYSGMGQKGKSTMTNSLKETNPEKTQSNRSKITAAFPPTEPKGIPLSIPLHANAKDINLTYHIDRFLNYSHSHSLIMPNKDELDLNKTVVSNEANIIHEEESRLLQRAIANNYVYLRNVYQKYATLNPLHSCNPEVRNPVMSRLQLYQFLRDIKICQFHMSLMDVDNEMIDVPKISLESEHNPFEPIYLWQFMHCILILAFAMFDANQRKEHMNYSSSTKLSLNLQKNYSYQDIFKSLLYEVIKPSEGVFEGRALFLCANLLPIKRVYELYKSVGEPHSARTLLKRICHRKDNPPISCIQGYRNIYDLKGTEKHFVLGDVNILYLNMETHYFWSVEDSPKLNKFASDPFYTDLRVFRNLGAKNVLECISSICPLILQDEAIVYIDSPITFLEFYEILINLAEQLSITRKDEESNDQVPQETEETLLYAESMNLRNDSAKASKRKIKRRKTEN